jgi:spermidine synthase
LPVTALLAFPAAVLLPFLLAFRSRRSRSGYLLTPVALMGLTTIVVEVVVLVWFQSLYGYLYGRLALLLSSFMLGMFAGAWAASLTARVSSVGRLSISNLGVVLLLGALLAIMAGRPPAVIPFLLLFRFGALAGDIFVIANRLYLGSSKAYGLGYGLELVGAFVGALATSSVLIPLAGLRPLVGSVLGLNLLGLVFLLTRPKGL